MSDLCLAGLIVGGYLIGAIATFAICAATDVEESDSIMIAGFWPVTLLVLLLLCPVCLIYYIGDVIYERQYQRNKRVAEAEEDGYIDSHYDI